MTAELVVALDVGGTSIKGWLCDESGTALRRVDHPTATAGGPDAAVSQIRATVRDLARTQERVAALGVVVPGLVDSGAGIAIRSTNLGWRDIPLRALLADEFKVPVAVDQDVRSAATAEAILGAARSVSSALVVPVGTGIAAAIVLDGIVTPGAHGGAGEIGHLSVFPQGEECRCGHRGCTEAYASAAAISRRYQLKSGHPLLAPEVIARAAHDPVAREVWEQAIEALAMALTAATLVLDPEVIVIGGGLSEAGDALLDPLRRRLVELLTVRPAPELRRARLGADAGRIGAAALAWQARGRPEIPRGWDASTVFDRTP